MQLLHASEANPADMRFMVRSVRPVKVFYVSTGRNAWWSTWITRYSHGCMHSTIESAKQYCERRRVQGTVFYIDELPSIGFIAPERALLISEINTEHFFQRFNVEYLEVILSVLPTNSFTLKQVEHMFNPTSELWPWNYPGRDSAILTFCSNPKTLLAASKKSGMKSYASHSMGGNYYLGWASRSFSKKRSALYSIVQSFREHANES